MKQIVSLENLSCQNCAKHVTEHFLKLDGVRQVQVDLDGHTALVETDQALTADQYQSALAKTIYKVRAVDPA